MKESRRKTEIFNHDSITHSDGEEVSGKISKSKTPLILAELKITSEES